MARSLDHLADAGLHGFEVADDQMHVSEDLADLVLQILALVIGEPAVQLEVHDGLAMIGVPGGQDALDPPLRVPDGANHRMKDLSRRQASRRQLLGDGINQERGVIRDRLQDRPQSLIPVRPDLGIEDPDRVVGRAPAVGERERRAHLGQKLIVGDGGQLLGREPAGVGLREGCERVTTVCGHAVLDALDERLELRVRLGRRRRETGGGRGRVGVRVHERSFWHVGHALDSVGRLTGTVLVRRHVRYAEPAPRPQRPGRSARTGASGRSPPPLKRAVLRSVPPP